jgi:hypothetical protein
VARRKREYELKIEELYSELKKPEPVNRSPPKDTLSSKCSHTFPCA